MNPNKDKIAAIKGVVNDAWEDAMSEDMTIRNISHSACNAIKAYIGGRLVLRASETGTWEVSHDEVVSILGHITVMLVDETVGDHITRTPYENAQMTMRVELALRRAKDNIQDANKCIHYCEEAMRLRKCLRDSSICEEELLETTDDDPSRFVDRWNCVVVTNILIPYPKYEK